MAARLNPIMILILFIILAIFCSGLFYVGRKIFHWLCLIMPSVNPKLFIIIPAVIVLSFAVSFLPVDIIIKKPLVWLNWFIVGLWVFFLLSFLLSDAVLLIGKLTKIIPSPMPQAVTLVTGWIVFAVVAVLTAFGTYQGRQISHVSYNVQIEKISSLENLNIVLISDTHLGYQNDDKWLSRIVREINAANPDVVVIAGDVFNDNFRALTNPDDALRSLQSISAQYGVYAVFGNHDGGNTFGEMHSFLERGNVKVLQDEYIAIEDKFVIVGRSDPSPIGGGAPERKDTSAVMAEIDTSLPVIVIEHQMTSMDEGYIGTADLVFAGHTHRGQMFPGNFITNLMYKDLNYGLSRQDDKSPHVVVTSGLGVWGPPFRVGTNNEVVSIDVRFQ